MKKDAYYFSHDSNAKDDPKCMLLIDQLGLEGYGIFWILIEILREQPEYKYPINLLPIIARRYNTSAEKIETVVTRYGLFQIENNEFFFSNSLNERMRAADFSRVKGIKGSLIRYGYVSKSDADAMTDEQIIDLHTHIKTSPPNNSLGSPLDSPLVPIKEKKVNKNKLNKTKENPPEKSFSDEVNEVFDKSILHFPEKVRPSTDKKIQSWKDTIDKLIRLDKHTKADILAVVDHFRNNDQFWSGNFLSIQKLRQPNKEGIKYMDFFLLKMDGIKKNGNPVQQTIILPQSKLL